MLFLVTASQRSFSVAITTVFNVFVSSGGRLVVMLRVELGTMGLRIVTLAQKLRKSFFGESEFLAPSCSSGSALTPDTLFEKIYRRVRELCSSF